METSEIVTIEIIDMSEEGLGIGHSDGMAVFVNGGVFGDKVKAVVTKVKKRYAFADAIEIVERSPYRKSENYPSREESDSNEGEDVSFTGNSLDILSENMICPYIEECGGCAFGMLDYEMQLALKEKHVKDKLERVAGIDSPKVNSIVRMDSPRIRYRNKATMAVYIDREGNPSVGFRGRKSHRVIDCKDCLIQAPTVSIVAEVIRDYIKSDSYYAADTAVKSNKKGPSIPSGQRRNDNNWLNSVTVRTSSSAGEVMVILGVRDVKNLPDLEALIMDLDEAIATPYSLESVVAADGRKVEILAGSRTINDEICGLKFEISPQSFYQVNPLQVEKLYELALDYAGVKGNPLSLLDLYCGVGTIGLIAASRMDQENGRVLGIESVKPAVIDANRNSVINGIVNARFMVGEAETLLPRLAQAMAENSNGGDSDATSDDMAKFTSKYQWEIETAKSANVVILDPPRAGCGEELLKAAADLNPEKIVYVSCDPATLARDLKLLMEKGYSLVECTPVDMFCETSHVEAVTLLNLVN